jgi:hypothetical protein
VSEQDELARLARELTFEKKPTRRFDSFGAFGLKQTGERAAPKLEPEPAPAPAPAPRPTKPSTRRFEELTAFAAGPSLVEPARPARAPRGEAIPPTRRHARPPKTPTARPGSITPRQFGLSLLTIGLLCGGAMAVGGVLSAPPEPLPPRGSVAPAATAVIPDLTPEDGYDAPELADDRRAPEPLPPAATIAWDPRRQALVLTDAHGRERLVGVQDVSRIIDDGGDAVTLELWGGRERLVVPRAVFESMPRRARHAMDYQASGNLREEDAPRAADDD